ncbi:hypothetical protein PFBG_03645 [Plasmodium falciparum 7G8]|uniref:Uncharacterized protein n=1 Tax=Plasmodium falciparum (isolate 7G8) TaxID=57266 RepID=W7EYN9_PLAF8|nr:hypothetical protein PFBG_03645 [Plasmodium falciparum 7G8]
MENNTKTKLNQENVIQNFLTNLFSFIYEKLFHIIKVMSIYFNKWIDKWYIIRLNPNDFFYFIIIHVIIILSIIFLLYLHTYKKNKQNIYSVNQKANRKKTSQKKKTEDNKGEDKQIDDKYHKGRRKKQIDQQNDATYNNFRNEENQMININESTNRYVEPYIDLTNDHINLQENEHLIINEKRKSKNEYIYIYIYI